jgi:hypothetical protein
MQPAVIIYMVFKIEVLSADIYSRQCSIIKEAGVGIFQYKLEFPAGLQEACPGAFLSTCRVSAAGLALTHFKLPSAKKVCLK